MPTTKKAVSAKKAGQKASKSPAAKNVKKTTAAKNATRSSSKTGATSATASKITSPGRIAQPPKQSEVNSTKRPARSNGVSKGIISSVVDKVTGIFSSTPQSAIDLLKTDHKKVSRLFDQVKANEDGSNVATFKKIKAELDTHTHIEEKIFYPYILEKGDKGLKDMTREALEEHGQAKQVLAELAQIGRDTPTFKAKLTVLMVDIEHHVKEEEDEMFPAVEDRFSEEVLATLGKQLEEEKIQYKSGTTSGTRSKRQFAR